MPATSPKVSWHVLAARLQARKPWLTWGQVCAEVGGRKPYTAKQLRDTPYVGTTSERLAKAKWGTTMPEKINAWWAKDNA